MHRIVSIFVLLSSLAVRAYSATLRTPLNRRQDAVGGYSCDPAACKLPSCYCPTTSPPGELAVRDTPQFVMLTFDDAVNVITYPLVQQVMIQKNPNGCKLPATFFVSTDYTDYRDVQVLYEQGSEIAIHTMTHPANANITEIEGCRKALNAYSGIPIGNMRGFRAPFLEFDMNTFSALSELGIQWDCSLTTDPRNAVWPYTYDNGFPYTCETGTCDYARKFPGLWEIPMYSLLDPSSNLEYAVMDPPGDPTFIMNLLQYNFKIHWEGNRAPMGLWLHAAWFLQDPAHDRIALLNEFIEWTQSYTNNQVYYVTGSQLLDWMQNPVGVEDIADHPSVSCAAKPEAPCNLRNCNLGSYFSNTCYSCPSQLPTPADPVPSPLKEQPSDNDGCTVQTPMGGCVQGSWQNCTCVCINENSTANGYCKDATGACTIPKVFDAKMGFYCPGDSSINTISIPTTTKVTGETGASTLVSTAAAAASTTDKKISSIVSTTAPASTVATSSASPSTSSSKTGTSATNGSNGSTSENQSWQIVVVGLCTFFVMLFV